MMTDAPSAPTSRYNGFRSYLAIATFIVVGALLTLPLFIGSAYSTKLIGPDNLKPKVNRAMPAPYKPYSGLAPLNFLASPPTGVTVDTFQGDCTGAPKHVFNVQDSDLGVCAQFSGVTPGWRVIWSNAHFVAVQNTATASADGTATFTLTTASSLGDWRVILFEPLGGTVQAVTTFTVIDAQNPKADISVSKGPISNGASSGNQVLFSVEVNSGGPDAANVQLTDAVPANTTFVSFDQLSGPVFACTNPTAGTTGNSVCTIASLARGEKATFVGTYLVDKVPNGTTISNTASASSATSDPNLDNNSSTAELTVTNTPCQLTTPDNITTDA